MVDNAFGDNPTVQWMDPNGRVISTSAPDVSVGQVDRTSNGASVELIFHSFQTGTVQMGVYTCRGCINVPKASIEDNCESVRADTTLGITCECLVLFITLNLYMSGQIYRSLHRPQCGTELQSGNHFTY